MQKLKIKKKVKELHEKLKIKVEKVEKMEGLNK